MGEKNIGDANISYLLELCGTSRFILTTAYERSPSTDSVPTMDIGAHG